VVGNERECYVIASVTAAVARRRRLELSGIPCLRSIELQKRNRGNGGRPGSGALGACVGSWIELCPDGQARSVGQ
jgi:hypothetical protein